MKRDLIKYFIVEIYSKPPKKDYETNKTIIKSTHDTWSSDLLDMNGYGPEKISNYRYFSVLNDKFGWTIPLKNI